jgi:hypothetical protein
MKKLLAIVAIAAFMTACNDEKKTDVTTTSADTTKMSADTTPTTVTPDTSATLKADTTSKMSADTSKKK